MPQLLIRYLLAVALAAGALLLVDSGPAYTPDAAFVGAHHAVWADDRTSANDPQMPLGSSAEAPAEPGYHDPQPRSTPSAAPRQPPRTHFARAPPVS